MLVLDDGDGIVFANGACELLLNQSERSMRGLGFHQVFKLPADYAERRERGGVTLFDTELATQRGHRVRVDLSEATLVDHPGWRVVALHDRARRHGGGDRGGGARAAMGAAAMLAHEIKNPLSGIRGAAQLLGDSGADGELTALITTEVDRVAALIDRMQDFTDTRAATLAPANIYPLLGHARRVAEAGFARGLPIEERFDPSLPPALIDGGRFLQIVVNLLKNAAEAVRDRADARIVVTTAYRHGMSASSAPGRPRQPLPIEICVLDNGPGAPADIAQHLFEPFVSGKPEGQGLGLPLVEKLMTDMGGLVGYSREGEPPWTVLRLMLPRARG
ncbi:two-component sensor histidine kinase [Sphingomonas baiyangensis]|uniref:histidine kinase n=1 Tax=Sphingomonas baiyangensis TaxID=2572576 RepID=A0A4U1L722_9SPHN|nr:two-component sensor histidine kinase [Sphingomonas baiyangensis]